MLCEQGMMRVTLANESLEEGHIEIIALAFLNGKLVAADLWAKLPVGAQSQDKWRRVSVLTDGRR